MDNTKMVWFTPESAKAILAAQRMNRHISWERVDSYARNMLDDKWYDNGETIKFNRSGRLVDGQHRLNAIIKANKPMMLEVRYNIDDDINIFDIGKSRTINDLYKFKFENRCINNITSLAGMILKTKNLATRKQKKITTNQIADDIINFSHENYNILEKSVHISGKGTTSGVAKKMFFQFFIYALIKDGVSVDEITDFFTIYNTGIPNENKLCATSPIVLRKTLEKTGIKLDGNMLIVNYQKGEFEYLYGVCYRAFFDYLNSKRVVRDYQLKDKIPEGTFMYRWINSIETL